jgi:hypothetical protein
MGGLLIWGKKGRSQNSALSVFSVFSVVISCWRHGCLRGVLVRACSRAPCGRTKSGQRSAVSGPCGHGAAPLVGAHAGAPRFGGVSVRGLRAQGPRLRGTRGRTRIWGRVCPRVATVGVFARAGEAIRVKLARVYDSRLAPTGAVSGRVQECAGEACAGCGRLFCLGQDPSRKFVYLTRIQYSAILKM